MKTRSLLRLSCAAALAVSGHHAPAQPIPPVAYFYITSDPGLLVHAFTPILQCRTSRFDGEQIGNQYQTSLRRLYKEKWFQYAHHMRVRGPFSTAVEAKTDLDRALREARQLGRVEFPKELGALRFAEFTVAFAEVRLARENRKDRPYPEDTGTKVQVALTTLPIYVYWPSDYSLGGDTTTTAGIPGLQHLKPSAAVLWIEDGVDVRPGSADAAEVQMAAQRFHKAGVRLLVLLPATAANASAKSLIAGLKAGFNDRPKDLEIAFAPEGDAPRELRTRAIRFLGVRLPELRINEFMANNVAAVKGPAGDFPDWIEILNSGRDPVDLGGMYFRDKAGGTPVWRIPADDSTKTTLAPGGMFVLWLDGRIELGAAHAPFRLSSRGETIALLDVDGTTVLDQVDFGPQVADKSSARLPDGGTWASERPPTPGKPNQ